MQLGAGGIADDPEPIRHTEPAIARECGFPARVDAIALEPEVVDREGPANREQDRMTFGGRAIGQVNDVRPIVARAPMRGDCASLEPDVDPVLAQRVRDDRRVARVIGGHEPVARLDDGRRDAEADVRLGELAAGRAAAENQQGFGQLAGEGRLAIRPDLDRFQAAHRWDLRERTHGDHHVSR